MPTGPSKDEYAVIERNYALLDSFSCDFQWDRHFTATGRHSFIKGSIVSNRVKHKCVLKWKRDDSTAQGGVRLIGNDAYQFCAETASWKRVKSADYALAGECGVSGGTGVYVTCLLLGKSDFWLLGKLIEITRSVRRRIFTFRSKDEIITQVEVSDDGLICTIRRFFEISSGNVEETTDFENTIPA